MSVYSDGMALFLFRKFPAPAQRPPACRPFIPFFLILLAALLVPLPAAAWGSLGHRLVASLAEAELDPQVRAEITALLASESDPTLAGIANWADQLRGSDPDLGRKSARWHYVNIGEHDCRYDAGRDCPGGNCVVEAIHAQTAILADRSRPEAERLQALKFVVHLIGDVHQPMHAGHAHDRGGNDYQVNYHGKGSNLHSLWDSGLLNHAGLGEAEWLQRLQEQPTIGHLAENTTASPATWAEQACAIVQQPGVYPDGHILDTAYYTRHLPVAEAQLRLAGARLAQTLNAALAPPESASRKR